ncbi:peptide-methionine (S)-S-oxide reductase MsrA [Emticicia sp.]|uniref:peptide-methionine (S)-S-oxide reductase MsrA n=1 Tax=Emticicia sp. TaxID=1930953 RepID=UPI0037505714
MNKPFILSLTIGVFITVLSCSTTTKPSNTEKIVDKTVYGNIEKAYFAAGCFWCEEAIFESLKGVKEAVSGYSGGHTKNPTYEDVNTETTGHAESVEVQYDPKIISYETLLKVYFGSQDPTQVKGQGPDRGDSYRSIIFYKNETEKMLAENYKKELGASGKYKKPIAAEIVPFQVFWKAEGYHQDYERNHPENPYVQNVSIPRLERMKAQFPELLKK